MIHWWIDDFIDWVKGIPFWFRKIFCKWKRKKMCPYRGTEHCNWTFCPMKEAKRYREYVARDKDVEEFLHLISKNTKFVGCKEVLNRFYGAETMGWTFSKEELKQHDDAVENRPQ